MSQNSCAAEYKDQNRKDKIQGVASFGMFQVTRDFQQRKKDKSLIFSHKMTDSKIPSEGNACGL